MKKVNIYTDGACSGNPGKGGWAAILQYNNAEKVLSGGEVMTTNNRMELTAVIEALKALNEPCEAIITTDSKYVVDAINKGWLESWRQNGWRKADKKRVLNAELWQELLVLLSVHSITFKWIKGHNGQPQNERCDKIAVSEYNKI